MNMSESRSITLRLDLGNSLAFGITVDGTCRLLRKIQYVLGLRSWHSEFG